MPRHISKIWDYFEVINVDGKKSARCNYCRKTFGTNATKLKGHIQTACKQCPEDVKIVFHPYYKPTREEPYSVSVPESNQVYDLTFMPGPSDNNLNSLPSCSLSQESSFSQLSDTCIMTSEKKSEIDLAFARAIYATGMPFNLLESTFWQRAITALNPTYSVPTRYMISNSLLDSEYQRIRKLTSEVVNQAEALALVMNGWSDINGKGSVNFIITTPKPYFYKCIYPPTSRETSAYLFAQLKAIIDEIGPSKFVVVVTDNTNNMKAMWRMVESEYVHIFAVGCASHTLNLLLKDIVNLNYFKTCNEIVTKIIKYMKKRHVELAYFEEIQKDKYGNNKKTLKLPSQTRWGSCVCVIMMESFLCNREALEATAICQDLNIDKDVKQHLLTEDLWIKVNSFVNILKPIFVAITKLESDKAVLSEVPQMFEYVRENIRNALNTCESINDVDEIFIIEAIRKRRFLVEKPIHFAANILDPKYRGLKLSPHEISIGQEFIYQYARNQDKNNAIVMSNLAEYQAKSGFYSQAGIWTAADHVEASTWWKGLCGCQILSSIASKLLSVPPSSAFGNTLARPRNRMTTDRLQKLITVRSNIRILSEVNENVNMLDEEEYLFSSSSEEEVGQEIRPHEQEAGLQDFNFSESENSGRYNPLT